MAGYRGYSMSNNAYDAYMDGERPMSKWTKTDIIAVLRREGVSPIQIEVIKKIPAATLKEIGLKRSSWHHTSSHYNRTDFYVVDVAYLEKIRPGMFDEKPKKKSSEPKQERWIAEFLVWSGTRKHPHAEEVTSEGILKGNWFYLPDGTKKSTTARGFRLIRRLRDVFPFDLPHIPQEILLRPHH